MSEQEVFNSLSELEQYFFYRQLLKDPAGDEWKALDKIHSEIKSALVQWHELTGCKNE